MYVKSFSLGNLRIPFFRLLSCDYKLLPVPYIYCSSNWHCENHCFPSALLCEPIQPSVALFNFFYKLKESGDWVTVSKNGDYELFVAGGVEVRDWKDLFVFVDQSLIPPGRSGLLDRSRLKYKSIGVPSVFGVRQAEVNILCTYRIRLCIYPEAVLFKSRVARCWECGTLDFTIELDGRETSFKQLIDRQPALSGVVFRKVALAPPPVEPTVPLDRSPVPPTVAQEGPVPSELPEVSTPATHELVEDVVDVSDGNGEDVAEEMGTQGNTVGSRLRKRKSVFKSSTSHRPKKLKTKVNRASLQSSSFNPHEEVLDASSCHRDLQSIAPSGWVNGLMNMYVPELFACFNRSIFCSAIVGSVMDSRLQENAEESGPSKEQYERLMTEKLALEAKVDDLELDCGALQSELSTVRTDAQRIIAEKEREVESLGDQVREKDDLVKEAQDALAEKSEKYGRLIVEVIPRVCKSFINGPEVGELLSKVCDLNRIDAEAGLMCALAADGMINLEGRNIPEDIAARLDSALDDLANVNSAYLRKLASDPEASPSDLLQVAP